jgi:hypothetical protein
LQENDGFIIVDDEERRLLLSISDEINSRLGKVPRDFKAFKSGSLYYVM